MTAATKDLRCPDCQVEPDGPHEIGCDVARCPLCGTQQLQCREHEFAEVFAIWTGAWPGNVECEREGWWCIWRPGNGGWVACEPDHPEARPDLNRLLIAAGRRELVWSRERQQWVRP
ncbi:hypothetical protein ACIBQX_11455 [Nonomuraea sp. NPDC049714]|uniref:hypothetical protein n=1 Tax=Nonomuraea sp. NPDC049714 TaxID=3364357 RepID=UPI00379771EA